MCSEIRVTKETVSNEQTQGAINISSVIVPVDVEPWAAQDMVDAFEVKILAGVPSRQQSFSFPY